MHNVLDIRVFLEDRVEGARGGEVGDWKDCDAGTGPGRVIGEERFSGGGRAHGEDEIMALAQEFVDNAGADKARSASDECDGHDRRGFVFLVCRRRIKE